MTRRRRVLVLLVAVALGVCGAAFAYFTSAGSGAGTATNALPVNVTLSPGTTGSDLYPGGSTALAVSVSNPNTFPVRLGQLALATTEGTGGYDVDGPHAACSVTDLSYATQSNGGAGWTLAPSSTATLTLSGALTMATTAADACQGAGFTVHLRAAP